MGFTGRFNCRRNEHHDFPTLLNAQSNYRLKNNNRDAWSTVRVFWLDFFKTNDKQGGRYVYSGFRSSVAGVAA